MVGAVEWSWERRTETLGSENWDREARKRCAARAPQIVENLWPDFS